MHDALQLLVVSDACGERDPVAHTVNLRDIGLKYREMPRLDVGLSELEREGVHARFGRGDFPGEQRIRINQCRIFSPGKRIINRL